MENAFSPADMAAVLGDEKGGFGGWTGLIALLIIAGIFLGGNGFGFGRNDGFGQYATAASQQEILFGQQFQGLDNKIDRIGNGIADATYALNNSIHGAQDTTLVSRYELGSQLADCCCTTNRNIDQVRYDMSLGLCDVKQNDNANTQKILDLLYQNKIEALQGKVNQLELQSAMCGVPRISTYAYGVVPQFANCGSYYGGTTF